ncbi:hypothetical protein M440DRAFT_93298 [Trichoderma longibrachiatum ATCC 18648]|uniref:Uncharacterized protein n=1 Tax=Trichoderma longibrachiatum ATCC 18648 TaxID=983965 RepID=A0A2T4CJS9_TRILO|nr:hypothetical protein M440DRAFT_93298 [Trichoderma longibrachiatum ATCC 18648]
MYMFSPSRPCFRCPLLHTFSTQDSRAQTTPYTAHRHHIHLDAAFLPYICHHHHTSLSLDFSLASYQEGKKVHLSVSFFSVPICLSYLFHMIPWQVDSLLIITSSVSVLSLSSLSLAVLAPTPYA